VFSAGLTERSISGGVTETAKAAASPWHRSSRGTDSLDRAA